MTRSRIQWLLTVLLVLLASLSGSSPATALSVSQMTSASEVGASAYDAATHGARDDSASRMRRGPPMQAAGAACEDSDSASAIDVAAKTAPEVVRPLSRVEASTLDDALRPAKPDHVFVPKHNFDPLVARYGTREDAMEQIVRGLSGPGLPSAGRFEVTRTIGGQGVVIRGAVVDGVPRIGTAFTP